MPSARRSKPKPRWAYLVRALTALTLLLIAVVVGLVVWLLPYENVRTPRISGTVVDAVTGRPLPGMDVCLLVTSIGKFGVGPNVRNVERSEAIRTDASGKFSFANTTRQLVSGTKFEGYGIAVTDPAARWNEACGADIALLGGNDISDIFYSEAQIHFSNSSANSAPPYFPVAMVKDPSNPHPLPYGLRVSFGHPPDGGLLRKISNPGNLTIPLVPLLRDEKECQSAQDSGFAELCRQMNKWSNADALRKIWNISPDAQ